MRYDLQALARALDGDVVSAGVNFRAPGHSWSDRSGRILVGPNYPEGFWVKSFAGDDELSLRDYVRLRLGLSQDGTLPKRAPRPATRKYGDPARTATALAIWHEAGDPRGTPVEAYLERRGLDLPHEAAGEAIRFHPSCPFGGKQTPAMVCLVRNVVTNEPQAIHRTAVTRNGQKAEINGKGRLALGPAGGGAIKLTPDEEVTLCLGIGEGLETALSLRRLPEFGRSPVWSLISAGGVGTLQVLSGIESLWIAVDHDQAGLTAARRTASRWQAAGAEAFLITPSAPRADLNDLFTGYRHAQP